MGEMEKKSKKRKQRQNLQNIILSSVAAAGLLSVALVAPNVVKLLDGFVGKNKTSIHRARRRLVEAGLLAWGGNGRLRVTPRGEAKLRQLEVANYKIKKPKRWDSRWRMLVFDISEKRKTLRDKVRRTLQAIGFFKLQDSVWVYPYDCEDLIVLMKSDFKIGEDLLYVIADTIENDMKLRMFFSLKN